MIVLSLGGSLINPSVVNVAFLRKFREFVLRSKEKFVIVCGGGSLARGYMDAARSLRDRNPDLVGIQATLLNAGLLGHMFGCSRVYSEPGRVVFSKVLCAGGWKPGCSTDLDAVLWAEAFGQKTVYNLSNIDYVYDKDPRKFKSAKPLKSLCWSDYFKIIGRWKSGMNVPFDPVASRRAMSLDIRLVVLNGKKINNVSRAIEGKSFIGTVVE